MRQETGKRTGKRNLTEDQDARRMAADPWALASLAQRLSWAGKAIGPFRLYNVGLTE